MLGLALLCCCAARSRSVNLMRSERAQSRSLSSSAATSSDLTSDHMPQKYHQLLQADFLRFESWTRPKKKHLHPSRGTQRRVEHSQALFVGAGSTKTKPILIFWVKPTWSSPSLCNPDLLLRVLWLCTKKGPLIRHLTLQSQMKHHVLPLLFL